MPNNLRLLLIGAGQIGQEYCKVLETLKIGEVHVVSVSEKSSTKIKNSYNFQSFSGGHKKYLEKNQNYLPTVAIVAVNISSLFRVTKDLIEYGIKNILVEKPAGNGVSEINKLYNLSLKFNVNIYIAFNRRFYSSVDFLVNKAFKAYPLEAIRFEFTEWPNTFLHLYQRNVLKNWLLSNSSHVIDLAFYLMGKPKILNSTAKKTLGWHPTKIFTGSGVSEKNIPFTYHAHWGSSGRWGLECYSSEGKWILSPLEELHFQKTGSILIKKININGSNIDLKYKPGFFNQIQSFLFNRSDNRLLNLKKYKTFLPFYEQIKFGNYFKDKN